MKKFKCYDCEEMFEAESREDILDILFSHYTKLHRDVMDSQSHEDKKAWMVQFDKDWVVANEV